MMAVGTGAFGAHGLENKLSEKYMSVWEKATMYQMYHGLGLLIIGVISGTTAINVSGQVGYFSSDRLLQRFFIYLSTYTNSNFRCYYTIGGVLFIAGWLMLIIATFKYAG